jgi:hypothetical protein
VAVLDRCTKRRPPATTVISAPFFSSASAG